MDEDLRTKHLAQAGYLGPKAQEEARRRAETVEVAQYHGTVTGRWPGKGGRVTNTVYSVKHMVVTGELTTGFQFYGLFDTVERAGQWATHNLKPGTPYRVHNMSDVRSEA